MYQGNKIATKKMNHKAEIPELEDGDAHEHFLMVLAKLEGNGVVD